MLFIFFQNICKHKRQASKEKCLVGMFSRPYETKKFANAIINFSVQSVISTSVN